MASEDEVCSPLFIVCFCFIFLNLYCNSVSYTSLQLGRKETYRLQKTPMLDHGENEAERKSSKTTKKEKKKAELADLKKEIELVRAEI